MLRAQSEMTDFNSRVEVQLSLSRSRTARQNKDNIGFGPGSRVPTRTVVTRSTRIKSRVAAMVAKTNLNGSAKIK